jgi:signal transduction histidine kinase
MIYSKFSSKIFIKPLERILEGVNKMISGDYGTTITIQSNNEFKAIGKAFNEMSSKVKEAQALRIKAEENRKKLVMDIAHDLKNPLASIMGYSEYILNEQDLTKEALENYLTIIHENSKRSNKLINDLFEYSKLDSQAYHLKFKTLDFTEYLRTLISNKITELEDHGFVYDFRIPDKAINLTIDPDLMNRALLNIINNAIKYNTRETKLSIKLLDDDQTITLIITDNGIGIDPALQEKIFEPFTHEANELNKDSSGLGLAITKKIITKHHGTIDLNHDYQKGTQFIITLNK